MMERYQADWDSNYYFAHYGHTPDPKVTGTWDTQLMSNPEVNPYYLVWEFECCLCDFVRGKC